MADFIRGEMENELEEDVSPRGTSKGQYERVEGEGGLAARGQTRSAA